MSKKRPSDDATVRVLVLESELRAAYAVLNSTARDDDAWKGVALELAEENAQLRKELRRAQGMIARPTDLQPSC